MNSRFPNQFLIWVLWLFGCASAISTSLFVIRQNTIRFPSELRWNSWAYSEWLINYSGGFVRRGFAGELLNIHDLANINFINAAVFVIAALLAASSFLVSAAIIARKRSQSLLIASLLVFFVPGGIVQMAANNEYYFRKETVFILFVTMFLLLKILMLRNGAKLAGLYLLYALLFPVSVVFMLIHESFLFIAVPVLLASMHQSAQALERPSIRRIAIAYAIVSLGCFLSVAIFKGTSEVADAIWASIDSSNRLILKADASPVGAIQALAWSLRDGISLSIRVVKSGYFLYWLLPISLSLCFVIVFTLMIDGREQLKRGITHYACILIGIGPLFILGWDWGRWIAAANLLFFPSYIYLHRLRGTGQQLGTGDKCRPLQALALCLFAISSITTMPECCLGGSGSQRTMPGIIFDALLR